MAVYICQKVLPSSRLQMFSHSKIGLASIFSLHHIRGRHQQQKQQCFQNQQCQQQQQYFQEEQPLQQQGQQYLQHHQQQQQSFQHKQKQQQQYQQLFDIHQKHQTLNQHYSQQQRHHHHYHQQQQFTVTKLVQQIQPSQNNSFDTKELSKSQSLCNIFSRDKFFNSSGSSFLTGILDTRNTSTGGISSHCFISTQSKFNINHYRQLLLCFLIGIFGVKFFKLPTVLSQEIEGGDEETKKDESDLNEEDGSGFNSAFSFAMDDDEENELSVTNPLELSEASSLTHSHLLRQAAGVAAEAALLLLFRACRTLLAVADKYKQSLHHLIDLHQYQSALSEKMSQGAPYEEMLSVLADARVQAVADTHNWRKQYNELRLLVRVSSPAFESLCQASYLAGADGTAIAAAAALAALREQVQEGEAAVRKLQAELLAAQAAVIDSERRQQAKKEKRKAREEQQQNNEGGVSDGENGDGGGEGLDEDRKENKKTLQEQQDDVDEQELQKRLKYQY